MLLLLRKWLTVVICGALFWVSLLLTLETMFDR